MANVCVQVGRFGYEASNNDLSVDKICEHNYVRTRNVITRENLNIRIDLYTRM